MTGGSTRDAGRSVRLLPGPEPVGILAAVVVALAFLMLTGGLSGGATPGPSASPSTSRGSAESDAPGASGEPGGDVVAGLLGVINERLIQHGESLTRELARDPLRPERLADVIGEMRATARLGTDTVADLEPRPDAPNLGGDLAALYADVDRVASDTLSAAADEPAAYGTGGRRLLEVLDGLPPLHGTLVGAASPGPSGGGGPPAGEQIENGGFESGVGAPWRLSLADGALATLRSVTTLPAAGSRAARIEILTATEARGAVSFRQAGLELEAGRAYVVAIAVRATADREVRVRIASATGEAYASRIVDAGIAWNAETWAFTAPVTDRAAVLEIDLGRSMEAVWIDGVSFRPR